VFPRHLAVGKSVHMSDAFNMIKALREFEWVEGRGGLGGMVQGIG